LQHQIPVDVQPDIEDIMKASSSTKTCFAPAQAGPARVGSLASTAHELVPSRDTFVIFAAGIICLLPIIVLIGSAFMAVPGSEAGDDGLASEGSLFVRAFTMGWMVCLAVKLCREFAGLVGYSSGAALLSC